MTPLLASEVAELARLKRLLDPLLPETSKALFGFIDRLASEWTRLQSNLQSAIGEGKAQLERAEILDMEVRRLRGELQQWIQITLGDGEKQSDAVVELTGWKEEGAHK